MSIRKKIEGSLAWWHDNLQHFLKRKIRIYVQSHSAVNFQLFSDRHWLLHSAVLWTRASIWNENSGQFPARGDPFDPTTSLLFLLVSLLFTRGWGSVTSRDCRGILCPAVSTAQNNSGVQGQCATKFASSMTESDFELMFVLSKFLLDEQILIRDRSFFFVGRRGLRGAPVWKPCFRGARLIWHFPKGGGRIIKYMDQGWVNK